MAERYKYAEKLKLSRTFNSARYNANGVYNEYTGILHAYLNKRISLTGLGGGGGWGWGVDYKTQAKLRFIERKVGRDTVSVDERGSITGGADSGLSDVGYAADVADCYLLEWGGSLCSQCICWKMLRRCDLVLPSRMGRLVMKSVYLLEDAAAQCTCWKMLRRCDLVLPSRMGRLVMQSVYLLEDAAAFGRKDYVYASRSQAGLFKSGDFTVNSPYQQYKKALVKSIPPMAAVGNRTNLTCHNRSNQWFLTYSNSQSVGEVSACRAKSGSSSVLMVLACLRTSLLLDSQAYLQHKQSIATWKNTQRVYTYILSRALKSAQGSAKARQQSVGKILQVSRNITRSTVTTAGILDFDWTVCWRVSSLGLSDGSGHVVWTRGVSRLKLLYDGGLRSLKYRMSPLKEAPWDMCVTERENGEIRCADDTNFVVTLVCISSFPRSVTHTSHRASLKGFILHTQAGQLYPRVCVTFKTESIIRQPRRKNAGTIVVGEVYKRSPSDAVTFTSTSQHSPHLRLVSLRLKGISLHVPCDPRSNKERPRLSSDGTRATVAERLTRSPPTKVHQAQSPVGSLDFHKRESCRTMPLVGGSSRGSPVSPAPLITGAAPYSLQSPLSALKTLLNGMKWRGGDINTLRKSIGQRECLPRISDIVTAGAQRYMIQISMALDSGETSWQNLFSDWLADQALGMLPGADWRTTVQHVSGHPRAGSLPDFASGNSVGRCRWWRFFFVDLPFPAPLRSGAAPFSPHFTIICSQYILFTVRGWLVEGRRGNVVNLLDARLSTRLEGGGGGDRSGLSLHFIRSSIKLGRLRHSPSLCAECNSNTNSRNTHPLKVLLHVGFRLCIFKDVRDISEHFLKSTLEEKKSLLLQAVHGLHYAAEVCTMRLKRSEFLSNSELLIPGGHIGIDGLCLPRTIGNKQRIRHHNRYIIIGSPRILSVTNFTCSRTRWHTLGGWHHLQALPPPSWTVGPMTNDCLQYLVGIYRARRGGTVITVSAYGGVTSTRCARSLREVTATPVMGGHCFQRVHDDDLCLCPGGLLKQLHSLGSETEYDCQSSLFMGSGTEECLPVFSIGYLVAIYHARKGRISHCGLRFQRGRIDDEDDEMCSKLIVPACIVVCVGTRLSSDDCVFIASDISLQTYIHRRFGTWLMGAHPVVQANCLEVSTHIDAPCIIGGQWGCKMPVVSELTANYAFDSQDGCLAMGGLRRVDFCRWSEVMCPSSRSDAKDIEFVLIMSDGLLAEPVGFLYYRIGHSGSPFAMQGTQGHRHGSYLITCG
ncbi:hypothetical protein PR048_030079 [Dryococelus australis]|uniref:Uncharacterized protein n=1 Tax=Dryococelus australis TaxID=614101 RepID=A0ABQ9GAK5_9NEOP|nr:hypothetical protein PR048_030079 [Dryococelus australis]